MFEVLRSPSECRRSGVSRAAVATRLLKVLAAIQIAAGTVFASLCITVIPVDAAAEDGNRLNVIASRKWEDISNDEVIYVFQEHLGDGDILKFKPDFCIDRTYYNVDDETSGRIDRRILKFEKESHIREYGYEIFDVSSNSSKCSRHLFLGIYGNVYEKNSFLFGLEKQIPLLVKSREWANFKAARDCSSAYLQSGTLPRTIGLGIGLVDVREWKYAGSLEACVDRVLLGTLGGLPDERGSFMRIGFAEEIAWKLATTFVRIFYDPRMGYGVFSFAERRTLVVEILDDIR